jgi:predicted Zn-dependent protease
LVWLVRAIVAPGALIVAWTSAVDAPAAEQSKPAGHQMVFPFAGQETVFPFADPQAMLDLFFGEPTEEEKRQLAQIAVSLREERRVGDAAVRAYLAHLEGQGVRVVSRGRDVEYLRELVDCLRPQMRQHRRYGAVKVYVAESPECDARSFPGGTLVFFQGLLETAESEAALVGIVGHELAHLDRGHLLRRIRQMKLAEKTFSGAGQAFSPQKFFTSGAAIFRMWTRPFEPELEMEADHDGARWAYGAGYDPREMARLLLSLQKRHQGLPFPMPEFLRSHPMPHQRHGAIMQLYEELARTEPREDLYVGKENLRLRVARQQREFPE